MARQTLAKSRVSLAGSIVNQLCEDLGFDPNKVAQIIIEPNQVTVFAHLLGPEVIEHTFPINWDA